MSGIKEYIGNNTYIYHLTSSNRKLQLTDDEIAEITNDRKREVAYLEEKVTSLGATVSILKFNIEKLEQENQNLKALNNIS
ncbi:hypothetical protein L5F68_08435 [Aliarcobacter butzleri]|uniref:hypothetical protein n=1 Tax=Aliarcobacter butzleri TaxID=28197 RepID=UPI001EDEF964|nr:hypothetical protein [Aliarcobacter butzleri]MCG3704359.1 hypothetical protein [Aliarcobacter butzleri]MDN5112959.1 hypothetical protein [Aliarcobacter butzleri]